MQLVVAPGWRAAYASLLQLLLLAGLLSGCGASAAPFEDSMAQRMLACTGCHGKDGRAVGDVYFPRIAGKPAGYLFNQLRNFRDGERSYSLMTGMVALLSDDYLQEIARYFSSLDLPYPAPPVSQLPADTTGVAVALVTQGDAGRKLAACADCHGAALPVACLPQAEAKYCAVRKALSPRPRRDYPGRLYVRHIRPFRPAIVLAPRTGRNLAAGVAARPHQSHDVADRGDRRADDPVAGAEPARGRVGRV